MTIPKPIVLEIVGRPQAWKQIATRGGQRFTAPEPQRRANQE